ncbi:hypothetical protein [Parashewanella spongiae]|nr:hypothetical protein [Parashewanella spongiae]
MASPMNYLASVNWNPISDSDSQFNNFIGKISKNLPTQLTINNLGTHNKSTEVVYLNYLHNGVDNVWRVEPEKKVTGDGITSTFIRFIIDLLPRSEQCRAFESELRRGNFEHFIRD